ncbi:sulfurtransferase [Desulfobacterota bacterium AH_259_B03_O07]|nr:sulfurtransferase [Desulfobacterota bacterium AH_259_B03_O07]
MSYVNSDHLVSVAWLKQNKDNPHLLIIDCPWDEGSYARAHIPGAVCRPGHAYVKAKDKEGRLTKILPGADEFKELAMEMGIGSESTVVLYDDWGSILATRLWWVLRYYGHDHAKVLNGGWQGWVSAGFPVSYKAPKHATKVKTFEAKPSQERIATLAELKENFNNADWQVLDVRSEDEYWGRAAHGNKRVGHIPGAVHLEWNLLLDNSKDPEAVRSFRSAEEIKMLLDKARVNESNVLVTHCQAAVRAALVAFALELVGYPIPKVYDGSMAEWANLDDTPLE